MVACVLVVSGIPTVPEAVAMGVGSPRSVGNKRPLGWSGVEVVEEEEVVVVVVQQAPCVGVWERSIALYGVAVAAVLCAV